jgi:hypothetical protein
VEGTKPDPGIQTEALRKKETPFLYSRMRFMEIDVPGGGIPVKSLEFRVLQDKRGKMDFIFAIE